MTFMKTPTQKKSETRISNSETNLKFKFSNPQTPEVPAKGIYSVIPAKAGIQNRLKILGSGSRFACPE